MKSIGLVLNVGDTTEWLLLPPLRGNSPPADEVAAEGGTLLHILAFHKHRSLAIPSAAKPTQEIAASLPLHLKLFPLKTAKPLICNFADERFIIYKLITAG